MAEEDKVSEVLSVMRLLEVSKEVDRRISTRHVYSEAALRLGRRRLGRRKTVMKHLEAVEEALRQMREAERRFISAYQEAMSALARVCKELQKDSSS